LISRASSRILERTSALARSEEDWEREDFRRVIWEARSAVREEEEGAGMEVLEEGREEEEDEEEEEGRSEEELTGSGSPLPSSTS